MPIVVVDPGGVVVMAEAFWAPRDSFLSPIPEVDIAADLLASAADCLLACNEPQARSCVEAADMPKLRAYTHSIQSQTTREIHRVRALTDLPMPTIPRGPRRPSLTSGLAIYRRDGFRCRYCRSRIIYPGAQSVISELLPNAVSWGRRDIETNAAFYTLKGVLDHVVPYARGGTSEPGNVVTSCQPCNYGKGTFLIEQVGISDPRLRPPLVDDWDGLIRVLPLRKMKAGTEDLHSPMLAVGPARRSQQAVTSTGFATTQNLTSSLSAADRQHLDALLRLVEASVDLGLTWTLNQVLLVKIPGHGVTISALGIEPGGSVQVPWFVGPHKRQFRIFAETLAAALPGGMTHETEKMWGVRCFGRAPRISDLMRYPGTLRSAFEALDTALTKSRILT